MPTATSPKQQRYTQVACVTTDRNHLVVMLYEGAVRFVVRARQATLQGDYETKYENIRRTQRILAELSGSLNPEAGGEIASALSQTYEHLSAKLVEAAVGDGTEELDHVLRLLQKLLAAWREAEAKCRETETQEATMAAA